MAIQSEIPENHDIQAAWVGADICEISDKWRWCLSTTEVAELEDAARKFLADYGDIVHLTPENFVVPTLRLWLSMPGDRPLPECFAQRYGSTEIGDRGGVIASERQCCPFLTFRLTVEPQEGPIWLELTGPAGTREMLMSELGLG